MIELLFFIFSWNKIVSHCSGVSHYGVCDLEALAQDTHKFESRYLDSMIAPYNEETKHIYKERSPINHIENFNCPVAFFQGAEDKVKYQYIYSFNPLIKGPTQVHYFLDRFT